MTDFDTRNKILKVAGSLFAEKGFEGASMRDIARGADVNLAAINYHFKNKQSLYWEIYSQARRWLVDGFKHCTESNLSFEDTVIRCFEFLLKNGNQVRNIFKLILTELESVPDEITVEAGPPGQDFLLEVLSRELDSKQVSKEASEWVVKLCFTSMTHWSLMLSTGFMQRACEFTPGIREEYIKQALRHQVRALLSYVKQNSSSFTDLEKLLSQN